MLMHGCKIGLVGLSHMLQLVLVFSLSGLRPGLLDSSTVPVHSSMRSLHRPGLLELLHELQLFLMASFPLLPLQTWGEGRSEIHVVLHHLHHLGTDAVLNQHRCTKMQHLRKNDATRKPHSSTFSTLIQGAMCDISEGDGAAWETQTSPSLLSVRNPATSGLQRCRSWKEPAHVATRHPQLKGWHPSLRASDFLPASWVEVRCMLVMLLMRFQWRPVSAFQTLPSRSRTQFTGPDAPASQISGAAEESRREKLIEFDLARGAPWENKKDHGSHAPTPSAKQGVGKSLENLQTFGF